MTQDVQERLYLALGYLAQDACDVVEALQAGALVGPACKEISVECGHQLNRLADCLEIMELRKR